MLIFVQNFAIPPKIQEHSNVSHTLLMINMELVLYGVPVTIKFVLILIMGG